MGQYIMQSSRSMLGNWENLKYISKKILKNLITIKVVNIFQSKQFLHKALVINSGRLITLAFH